MNWKKITLMSLAILFMIGNLYLIYKKDSKINRLASIDQWTTVKQQNLVQSENTSGVITPSEEQNVYFSEKSGEFKQFLVKKGEEVQTGTPLFEYEATDVEASRTQLNAEKTKLQGEIDSIETNIEQLESLQSTLTTEENAKDEKEKQISSNEMMINSLETEIYEKELEQGKLESEIEKVDELINAADQSLPNLTVTSEISGIVTNLSQDLENPLITIAANTQQVEGVFKEDEMKEFTEGMKVIVTSDTIKKAEGTISEISAHPAEKAKLNKTSKYPFVIQLNETPEETVPFGSHVTVKIITKEVNDAITVPETAVDFEDKKAFVYVIKDNGTIAKQKVDQGLQIQQVQQVTKGVEQGELIVYPAEQLKNKSQFFTPIDSRTVSKKALKQMDKKEIFRYLSRGFLSN